MRRAPGQGVLCVMVVVVHVSVRVRVCELGLETWRKLEERDVEVHARACVGVVGEQMGDRGSGATRGRTWGGWLEIAVSCGGSRRQKEREGEGRKGTRTDAGRDVLMLAESKLRAC